MAIRVAIIEDQSDIRDSLRVLIAGSPGFQIAAAYGAMEEALCAPAGDEAHVMLVDIGLPGMSGTEGIPLLKQRFPQTIPLVLSVYEDDDRIFRALCAGAVGYLLKTTPPARLLESIREAVEGGAPMTPAIARRVVSLFQHVPPPKPPVGASLPTKRAC